MSMALRVVGDDAQLATRTSSRRKIDGLVACTSGLRTKKSEFPVATHFRARKMTFRWLVVGVRREAHSSVARERHRGALRGRFAGKVDEKLVSGSKNGHRNKFPAQEGASIG